MVKLFDGTSVPSDSEEWRAECEARYILSLSQIEQRERLESIARKRGGQAAAERVRRAMNLVWPAYVLDMPTRDVRRAYLAEVERIFGANTRKGLEERILALHGERLLQGALA